MNGGTYSEALKVGFNEKQAGFLARLSIETKSETLEVVESRQKVAERERRNIHVGMAITGALILFAFMVGVAIGKAFA